MMGEARSFVDRFHYRKAENRLYCKEYMLPDVTPYSLVYIYIYIYTRHVHRCENISQDYWALNPTMNQLTGSDKAKIAWRHTI